MRRHKREVPFLVYLGALAFVGYGVFMIVAGWLEGFGL